MPLHPRTEANLATLTPTTAAVARKFIGAANKALEPQGLEARIISGLRTYEEQDALYAQGRTKPGKQVTKARGGFSNHNFGTAFDIGIFRMTHYLPEHPAYKSLGPLGESCGLEWGGRWKSPVDFPHYQLPGLDMKKLRAMKERGEEIP